MIMANKKEYLEAKEKERQKVFDEICYKMEIENLSLNSILKIEGMPAVSTFYAWILSDEKKQKKYACACEVRADNLFEELLTISDATDKDVIIDMDGNKVTNHNVIQRDRLRVDSRKWILSKMMPKKYGDKLDMTIDTKGVKPIITRRRNKDDE
jgi:hypothetical protein